MSLPALRSRIFPLSAIAACPSGAFFHDFMLQYRSQAIPQERANSFPPATGARALLPCRRLCNGCNNHPPRHTASGARTRHSRTTGGLAAREPQAYYTGYDVSTPLRHTGLPPGTLMSAGASAITRRTICGSAMDPSTLRAFNAAAQGPAPSSTGKTPWPPVRSPRPGSALRNHPETGMFSGYNFARVEMRA